MPQRERRRARQGKQFDMLVDVNFRAADYGAEVERILALDGDGVRPMPLVASGSGAVPAELRQWKARDLFAGAPAPEAAMAGLYLYFSRFEEAHVIAQDIASTEGSLWHGIAHRREPDAGNAAYWFRQAGKHSIFPELRAEAEKHAYDTGGAWDPFAFIDFCESARKRPGSDEEWIAMRVQLAEWQLLFDYCARGAKEKSL